MKTPFQKLADDHVRRNRHALRGKAYRRQIHKVLNTLHKQRKKGCGKETDAALYCLRSMLDYS